MTALAAALDALPKVELHCHIEGAMRPETVVDLARANSVPLPTADPTELYAYDSLDGFLRVFWFVQSTLARREDWARLAYESVIDGAAHGVVHREAFFTPARHLANGLDLADIIAGLDEGLAAAEADTGTTCLLIADMDRAFGPSAGLAMVEQLAQLRSTGSRGIERVIGIGMDSTERGVDPADFARMYNAAQLATPVVLAVSGNSPLLLGRRLWDETRVALFRQAVDDRGEPRSESPGHGRVTYGHGWVRQGALELFAESVALYPPLLPVLGPESPLECLERGGLPGLHELRLHQSTVWSWNRAIYDPSGGGHVRIELRALPAGPTVVDMLANGALLLGLTLGLSGEVEALLPGLPFACVRGNFILAAREGLDARLLWPEPHAPSPRRVPAGALVERLLPVARAGLVGAGVVAEEAEALLSLVRARLRAGCTGARWQRKMLARLEAHMPREDALAALLERYMLLAASGSPVHEWPLE